MDELKFISEQMAAIGVPYEFGEWSADIIKYPYFVGEITEEEPTTEDGLEQSVMLLNGFHRGSYADLLMHLEKIKRRFNSVYGLRAETENGAIAVFYAGSSYIPTGEAQLKRIQINLKIKKWKGEI